ncbi:hypothetical protein PG987_006013 [Apiospora arundinis]
MLDRDKFLDSFAELAMPKVDYGKKESPADRKTLLRVGLKNNFEFFQLRERAQEEASMLAANLVAPPPFLQANDPICFFAVDPKQQDWPKNGSVAPRVQFAWNDIPLEKTVKEQNESMEKALKNKKFTVYVHRTCHEETLETQIRSVHDSTLPQRRMGSLISALSVLVID